MNKQKLRFISIGFLLSAVLLAGFQLFYPEALPGSTFNGEATADSTDYQEKYESTLAELELQKQLNEAATSSAPSEGAELSAVLRLKSRVLLKVQLPLPQTLPSHLSSLPDNRCPSSSTIWSVRDSLPIGLPLNNT
ncbi:Hypothetical protein TFLO_2674 [Trichococcus flocculiformis]|uniref:Uncharacterized protein n=1 Tax=Trichococcus flocculiformis TaxID=82803 RepID=A0AB38BK65_9LACT|nr:hypothetical protein [Trichococcus flocculiformis]CZR01744.1 Hypothetical protein TFLO_2674 [Trichococcus flocculiformis]SFI04625.1 hypothetical protein SAMN04488507_10418 [Trichococcus flocculiformis]